MIIVMGITESCDKVILGLLQTITENSKAIIQMYTKLKEHGMQYHQGLLFVTDGSKGIRMTIEQSFVSKAIIQGDHGKPERLPAVGLVLICW